MPNFNGPRGFAPSRLLSSSAWNGSMNMYFIPAADTNQFNVGDAVKSAALSDANGIPGITKALGTDIVRGVIQGVFLAAPTAQSLQATMLDLTLQNIPAAKNGKDYYVMVVDDPDVLFEIQDDGLAVLTGTAANKNASFTVTNPTGAQQNSATVLSTATVAVTSTLNLRIMGLVQKPNNAFGINAAWLIKFNQHELRGNTAGV